MARQWLADQWSKTPQARKAQIERDLRSCSFFEEDPRFTLGEMLDHVHDRYNIEFRVNPSDFGVRDAQGLLQQPVGVRESANEDGRASLDELLRRVKANYVVEDGYVRIVPVPPEE
jgi:hypothetical protein